MSPDLASRYPDVADNLPAERRTHARYAVEMDLSYKLLRNQKVLQQGVGKTRDISSGGTFFNADQRLPAGGQVELSIDWPTLLNGVCPLQLRIKGKVMRNSGPGTAVKTLHYEFRTRATQSLSARGASPGAEH